VLGLRSRLRSKLIGGGGGWLINGRNCNFPSPYATHSSKKFTSNSPALGIETAFNFIVVGERDPEDVR
jgi:hypothetical protein